MKTKEVIDKLVEALEANNAAIDSNKENHWRKADELYDEAKKKVEQFKTLGIVDVNNLDDEEAERIGAAIAEDFCLKRSREHPDRYETMGGTFKNQGIARRAARHIKEGVNSLKRS